jgi:hypothetical protein
MVRLLKLRKSAFLRLVDDVGIHLLAAGMTNMRLARGQILMKQGDEVAQSNISSMYLIKSGELAVFIGGMEEKHQVATMHKGEIVGERALLLQEVRSATVRATKSTTLGVIMISQVEELVLRDPKIGQSLKKVYEGITLQSLQSFKRSPSNTDKGRANGAGTVRTNPQPSQGLKINGKEPSAGPKPNLPDPYEKQAFLGPISTGQAESRRREEEEEEQTQFGAETVPQEDWLGRLAPPRSPLPRPVIVAEERILELAQLGTGIGILPPFVYYGSNDAVHNDNNDPNPRYSPGPASLPSPSRL